MHVWGGISVRSATQVCIFTGCMESQVYQKILEQNLLPFINHVYPDGHRLWQDNDPKHSNSTKKWMKDNGVNHWPTPPESPVSNVFIIKPVFSISILSTIPDVRLCLVFEMKEDKKKIISHRLSSSTFITEFIAYTFELLIW